MVYRIHDSSVGCEEKEGLGAGGDLVWILYRLQSVLYFSLGMPIGKVFFFFLLQSSQVSKGAFGLLLYWILIIQV